ATGYNTITANQKADKLALFNIPRDSRDVRGNDRAMKGSLYSAHKIGRLNRKRRRRTTSILRTSATGMGKRKENRTEGRKKASKMHFQDVGKKGGWLHC